MNKINEFFKQSFLINAVISILAIAFAIFSIFFDSTIFSDKTSNLVIVILLSLIIFQNVLTVLADRSKYNKVSTNSPYSNNDEYSMLERFAFEIFMMIKDKDEDRPIEYIYDHIYRKFDRYHDSFRIFRDFDLSPQEVVKRVEKYLYRHHKYRGEKDNYSDMSFRDFFEELFRMPYRNINNDYSSKDFSLRNEELLERMQRMISKEIKNSSRYMETDTISRIIEDKLEKAMRSSKTVSNNDQNSEMNSELLGLLKKIAENGTKEDKNDYDNHRMIIKEIFHYMATPLAQMYAALDSLSQWAKNNDCGEKVPNKIKSLHNSYGLIYSILKSYREMSHLEYGNKADNDLLIADGISAAFLTYNEQSNKELLFSENNIPNELEKYSSNIVIMLLLPLIQNAITYSKQNTSFEISYAEDEGHHVFTIKNNADNSPNISEMNKGNGYSTKENHKGSGIYIAKNILRTLQNSSLNYSCENGIVETKVKIGRI